MAVLVYLVLTGLANRTNINNNIKPSSNSGGTEVATESSIASYSDRSMLEVTSSRRYSMDSNCLKANKDSVPLPLYRNLPKPYINLGFPKMGTSSIHYFFKCGGLDSTHLHCGRGKGKCAECARTSVREGLPPLAKCGNADVYAQIDNGQYFPQIELLEDLVHGHPNATFLLTFRDMQKWYYSITHWPPRQRGPHLDKFFKKWNITGSPSNKGKSHQKEFDDWYCRHVQRVRNVVSKNPSHTLVEVDIDDPDTGKHMEDIFGIDKSCWGQTNVNAYIHPELDQSKANLSRHTKSKANKRL